jgi:hypothetical protein
MVARKLTPTRFVKAVSRLGEGVTTAVDSDITYSMHANYCDTGLWRLYEAVGPRAYVSWPSTRQYGGKSER